MYALSQDLNTVSEILLNTLRVLKLRRSFVEIDCVW